MKFEVQRKNSTVSELFAKSVKSDQAIRFCVTMANRLKLTMLVRDIYISEKLFFVKLSASELTGQFAQ